MASNKHAHLDMIQGVINRLSHNSFLLKGWSVVLVSAMFALSANDSNPTFIFLAYFPAFAFWALDGYFLKLERSFRALFNHVRLIEDEENIDFSMDISKVEEHVAPWPKVIVSRTLLIFHGVIVLSIFIVMLLSI